MSYQAPAMVAGDDYQVLEDEVYNMLLLACWYPWLPKAKHLYGTVCYNFTD